MLHRKKERIFTFSHKMIDREPHLPGRRLSHSQIGRRSKRNSPKPKAHVFGSHSLETGGYIHERPTLCAQAALLSAGLLLRRPDSGTGGTNWSCRNPRTSGAGGTDRPHGAGWYSRPGGRRLGRRDLRDRSARQARPAQQEFPAPLVRPAPLAQPVLQVPPAPAGRFLSPHPAIFIPTWPKAWNPPDILSRYSFRRMPPII